MSKNFEILQKARSEKDLLGDDVAAEAARVEELKRAEEEQGLLQSSSGFGAPSEGQNASGPLTRDRQSVAPTHGPMEQTKPELDPLRGLLGQLESQGRKRVFRFPFWRRTPRQAGQSEVFPGGTLAQAALVREEEIKLVQRVFLAPGQTAPRMVVFCGVEGGNGCSWVCARASETLAAQVSGTVCVVDANLRSPSLHQYFGVDNSKGLAEAVLDSPPSRDYAQQLRGANLWVLPCGSPPSDPYALLASDGLQLRMKELRSVFDYVLIDAPPVNSYTDATLLGRLADGIVLVIEANWTRRETARKAKENLESANSRILALVLNKRTFPIPEVLYRKL